MRLLSGILLCFVLPLSWWSRTQTILLLSPAGGRWKVGSEVKLRAGSEINYHENILTPDELSTRAVSHANNSVERQETTIRRQGLFFQPDGKTSVWNVSHFMSLCWFLSVYSFTCRTQKDTIAKCAVVPLDCMFTGLVLWKEIARHQGWSGGRSCWKKPMSRSCFVCEKTCRKNLLMALKLITS